MKLGIIGGSGLYQLNLEHPLEKVEIKTPFGDPSGSFLKYKTENLEVYFLPRHGEGHRLLPSEVNYQANVYGFKQLGVSTLLSVSAVGSMRKEIEPGHFVIPEQYIDNTKGIRKSTFFGDGIVAHAHFADPCCKTLREYLFELCNRIDIPVHMGGTYLCMEGPQFSTRAESELYRHWQLNKTRVDVIGMTAMPEAKLAREAGLCYATIAMSTDYDCWNEDVAAVTAEEVIRVLTQNVEKSKKLITEILSKSLPSCEASCKSSMKHAIVTAKSHWPQNRLAIMETLLS